MLTLYMTPRRTRSSGLRTVEWYACASETATRILLVTITHTIVTGSMSDLSDAWPRPLFTVMHDSGRPYFALAITCGHYVRGRTPNEPACFILYWSTDHETAAYSRMAVARDGLCLAYHAGHEILATPEFAVLSAYLHEGIQPERWMLYPGSAIEPDKFPDERTRNAYEHARRRTAELLRQTRIGRQTPPLFAVAPERPAFCDADAEAREIWEAVQALVAERSAATPDRN